ncbi:MAG: UDP-N-acetylglucosamine 1-carboxyvinyltransferase [Bacillota bacterium]
MNKFYIQGKNKLKGEIKVSGAKNAALPIISATLLAETESRLLDIPDLRDVRNLAAILEKMGAKVDFKDNTMEIDPSTVNRHATDPELARKLRASYYLLGVMLAKEGKARTSLPGGCNIGNRPIDLHLKGFKALGAEVNIEHGHVEVEAENLRGSQIYLDYPSVGATVNIMLAATMAEGKTIIENAAREPEIIDLANFLTVMGANIKGAGTDIIRIEGVDKLKGQEHRIIPDRIEAGTFIIAGAISGEDVYVKNVLVEHIKPLLAKLTEMGVELEEDISGVRISAPDSLNSVDIKTLPYPGFPTDLQAQMMVILTQASEPGIVTETVWEDRFAHIDELARMGAKIKLDGHTALVHPSKLQGAEVEATDLRAGAALIIAGLAAEGLTIVNEISHVERGYENIVDKLQGIGAEIQREPVSNVTTA